jgi:hypothetical protein
MGIEEIPLDLVIGMSSDLHNNSFGRAVRAEAMLQWFE